MLGLYRRKEEENFGVVKNTEPDREELENQKKFKNLFCRVAERIKNLFAITQGANEKVYSLLANSEGLANGDTIDSRLCELCGEVKEDGHGYTCDADPFYGGV